MDKRSVNDKGTTYKYYSQYAYETRFVGQNEAQEHTEARLPPSCQEI
jgi:hypothetical protein